MEWGRGKYPWCTDWSPQNHPSLFCSSTHSLMASCLSQPVLLVHPLSDGFMPILDMNAPHLQSSQTCPSSFPYPPRWIRFCKPKTSLTKGIIWRDASIRDVHVRAD